MIISKTVDTIVDVDVELSPEDVLEKMSKEDKIEMLNLLLSDFEIDNDEIQDAFYSADRKIERCMPYGSTIMEQEFYDSLLILEKGYLRLSNSDIEKISEIAKSI